VNLLKTGSVLRRLLIVVPVLVALILLVLFMPAQRLTIEGIGMLSFETTVTLSIGYEAAYASPAEYLLNPSFTGGTTSWTLGTTTYDSTVYQDTAGSIKTINAIGRNKTATGTCSQTIGTAINSTDTVKLSLYWKKGYTSGVEVQDVKVEIALPSDPTTFITIWIDTQMGNIDWTAVTDLDVSSYFTETGTYQFRYYMYVENPNKPDAQVWAWIDNTHLDVTPAAVPDITNLPTSRDFGLVAESSSYWSNGSAPTWPLDDTECYFTVTNNSSQAVNIAIRATDFSGGTPGWTLAGTPGADAVVLKAGKSGDSLETNMVTLTTSDQAFITALGASTPIKWELKMETPISFSNGDPKTSTITLTATFV